MKLINLLEDSLNEMPDGLDPEQRKKWMLIQMLVFNKIARKHGWEENSSTYLSNLFKFGKVFADKYDMNFNKILSLSNDDKVELEKLFMEKLHAK